MAADDVVVTGIGMITPLGSTTDETVEGWRAGRSASRRPLPELAGTRLENVSVATLPEFDAAKRLGGRKMIKYMSDAAVLGCVAAREATTQAGMKQRFAPERIGLYAGTGLAGTSFEAALPTIRESVDEHGEFSCRLLGERGLAATNPLLSFKILANMPPCIVSMLESIKGPNLVFTPWEGQTASAMLEGWSAVSDGEVDCALVGAADFAAHAATVVYLHQAGLLSKGEFPAAAAAYLVLERRESAERDETRVFAHISSMFVKSEEFPATDPLGDRMGRSFAAAPAVLLALACRSGAAGWISVHGVDRHMLCAEVKEVG